MEIFSVLVNCEILLWDIVDIVELYYNVFLKLWLILIIYWFYVVNNWRWYILIDFDVSLDFWLLKFS